MPWNSPALIIAAVEIVSEPERKVAVTLAVPLAQAISFNIARFAVTDFRRRITIERIEWPIAIGPDTHRAFVACLREPPGQRIYLPYAPGAACTLSLGG